MELIINTLEDTRTFGSISSYYEKRGLRKVIYDNFVDPRASMYYVGLDWDTFERMPKHQQDVINNQESLYYWYKKYIVGFSRDLRAINRLIREIKSSKPVMEESQITGVLDAVAKILVDNELYELIPKHKEAKAKIISLLGKS